MGARKITEGPPGESRPAGEPLHRLVLKEVARVVESMRKVPERVRVAGRTYRILYLEDHARRMEEALFRQDRDRLNMLFGQLSSKLRYQVERVARKSRRREAKDASRGRSRASSGEKSGASTVKSAVSKDKKTSRAEQRRPGRARKQSGR